MMLNRTVCNVIQKTIFTNIRTYCVLQNALSYNHRQHNLHPNYLYSQQSYNLIKFTRFKSDSSKKLSKHSEYDEDDEDDVSADVDDYLYTDNTKIIETSVPSLRLDVIAKAGLETSRSKIDQKFFKNKLRLNGKTCSTKNVQINVGDEIDEILRRSPDNSKLLIVNRVVLKSISVTSDALRVKLLQNKSLLIEEYDHPVHNI